VQFVDKNDILRNRVAILVDREMLQRYLWSLYGLSLSGSVYWVGLLCREAGKTVWLWPNNTNRSIQHSLCPVYTGDYSRRIRQL